MEHAKDRQKFEQKRAESQILDLRKSIKEDPKNPAPLVELGRMLLYGGLDQVEEGKKLLRKAARLNESDGEPMEILAFFAAYHQEDSKAAVPLFQKAAVAYEKGGDQEKRNAMLNEAATVVNDEAWSALRDSDDKKAHKKAIKALEIYSDHIDALNVLGGIYLRDMNFAMAVELYRKGFEAGVKRQNGEVKLPDVEYWGDVETRPYIRSIQGFALSLLHQYKFEESLHLFKTLLDLVPGDNLGVRFLLGDVHFYMNQTKEAADAYEKYGESNAFFGTALLQFSIGKEKEAYDLLKRSFEQEPFTGCFLHLYLLRFKGWEKIENRPRGTLPDGHWQRKAHVYAWNELIGFSDDVRKQYQFDAAESYVRVNGPLWVRTAGSFEFLDRALFYANPDNAEGRDLLEAYGMISAEDRQRFGV